MTAVNDTNAEKTFVSLYKIFRLFKANKIEFSKFSKIVIFL